MRTVHITMRFLDDWQPVREKLESTQPRRKGRLRLDMVDSFRSLCAKIDAAEPCRAYRGGGGQIILDLDDGEVRFLASEARYRVQHHERCLAESEYRTFNERATGRNLRAAAQRLFSQLV